MYGKILIKCQMTVLTGMHIRGYSAFSAIGAVDHVVIRDALSGRPMLPGSSLKGKLRTLLAKAVKCDYITQECSDDPPEITRLFGTAGNKNRNEKPKTARLQFADAFLSNTQELINRGGLTEIKSENTILRLTSVAKPRHIERVVRGSRFGVNLMYDMENDEEIAEDFSNIARALKLLTMDYLGGHGSRGYGKVAFSDFEVEVKDGTCPEELEALINILKEVEEYGLLSLQA